MGGWGAVAPEALARAAPPQGVAEGFSANWRAQRAIFFFDPFFRQYGYHRIGSFSLDLLGPRGVFLDLLGTRGVFLDLLGPQGVFLTLLLYLILPYYFTLFHRKRGKKARKKMAGNLKFEFRAAARKRAKGNSVGVVFILKLLGRSCF
jgi:hypothetical protein